jgi:transcriptional regulator with XRE-family HTH domain
MAAPPLRRKIARPELVYAIARSGLMQQEVATAVGYSEGTLSRVIRGSIVRPAPETRRRLEKVLDTPIEELFPDLDGSDDVTDLDPADPWQSIIAEATESFGPPEQARSAAAESAYQ